MLEGSPVGDRLSCAKCSSEVSIRETLPLGLGFSWVPTKLLCPLQLSEDEIESLLDFMDVDGSSSIDYHEFVIGILEDKHLLTEAKLRAAFNHFDTDGNGKDRH